MLRNKEKTWLILLLVYTLAATSCVRSGVASVQPASRPVFVSENPESIYAADPNDPWNRIFRVLFTSNHEVRISDDFPGFPAGTPFDPFQVRMGSFPIRLSRQSYSRFERGDRAIEPVYPAFFSNSRPRDVLNEQSFTELTTALRLALDETKKRSPIERALMQADVWAVYDIIYARSTELGVDIKERKPVLLSLLPQFVRKLALTSEEIKSLRNNYLDAVEASKLPDLFSARSGWLEIELLPDRLHEHAADYRRATRVFVKPRTTPANPARFVESLKHNQHHDQLEAVALVIQNLLIDTEGRIVPSPVFYEAQFRYFKNDPKTGATFAEPQQFELSRRKLLTEPESGGLVEYASTSPAFLAAAGNDLDYATRIEEAQFPVMVPLRTRCTQCHNVRLTNIMTYSIHDIPPVPATRILKSMEQERALFVARRKEQRADFKALIAGR